MKSKTVTPLVPPPTYPAPQPLLPEMEVAAPYPVEALPQVMRDAANAIAHHVQAPLALAAMQIIGAAAHLAQTRVNAPDINNPDGMPCSLFLLTLADSGDRKSACRKLAFRVIDEHEREARNDYSTKRNAILEEANRLKGKKREDYLAECPLPDDPRTQWEDVTFESLAGAMIRGASVASWDTDEGGQMLGGSSLKADTRAATLGGLVKAFDSGKFERDRSRGNLEGSGFAYNRRLSINLLAQSVTVTEALHDPLLRGQGFLPRFLFADAPTLAGTRLLTPERLSANPWSDPRLQRFWERCRSVMATPGHIDLDTSEVKPPVLTLTEEATAVWLDFYNLVEEEQQALGEFDTLRAFAGRAGELARRLAAVFAFFSNQHEISAVCIEQSAAVVRYSLREWARYSASEKVNPDLISAAALMEWLQKQKWTDFDARTIQRKGPTAVRKSAKARNRILDLLVERQHLLTADRKHFRINPLATSATTAIDPASSEMSTCDIFATPGDSANPLGHVSQTVAKMPQPASPVNTGAVAKVAKVAALQDKNNNATWEAIL